MRSQGRWALAIWSGLLCYLSVLVGEHIAEQRRQKPAATALYTAEQVGEAGWYRVCFYAKGDVDRAADTLTSCWQQASGDKVSSELTEREAPATYIPASSATGTTKDGFTLSFQSNGVYHALTVWPQQPGDLGYWSHDSRSRATCFNYSDGQQQCWSCLNR